MSKCNQVFWEGSENGKYSNIWNILLDLTRQPSLKNKHASRHDLHIPQNIVRITTLASEKHCHGKCQSDDETLAKLSFVRHLENHCLPWGGSSF